MKDSQGIQDTVSIRITKGKPETFYVTKPITKNLTISKNLPYPHLRYDDHIVFHVTAHSQEEAETLLKQYVT